MMTIRFSIACGLASSIWSLSAASAAQQTAQVTVLDGSDATAEALTPAPVARPAKDHFALDLGATTLAPLSLGPELNVELPGRLLAQVHLGWMPEVYSQAISDGLQGAGAFDESVGDLIDGSFDGATTWRLGVGWRPFADYGFELMASYVHVSVQGGTNTGEVMALVPPDIAAEISDVASRTDDIDVNLDSSLHHVMLGAGWRWTIAERFVVLANVNYLHALDTNSTLELEGFQRLSRLTTPIVDEELNRYYTRYVKIPAVGLGVAYRFF